MDGSGGSASNAGRRVGPLVRAGIILGVGLGAFFDGIVFHQVLQWHHMLSSHSDPAVAGDLPLNVLVDGLFHVAAYAFTVVGVVLLWRALRNPAVAGSGRSLLGSVLSGWGLFNVVEGLVNHHLLGIHHVRSGATGGTMLWDLGFLAWGVLFVLFGVVLVRSDSPRRPAGSRQ